MFIKLNVIVFFRFARTASPCKHLLPQIYKYEKTWFNSQIIKFYKHIRLPVTQIYDHD